MNNKKGKLFSVWWFLVLAIVGISIVFGVNIFLSNGVDVRLAESTILQNVLVDCITEQGKIISQFTDNSFDIFSHCGLDKNTLESGIFYFNISLYSEGVLIKEVSEGTSSFERDCEIGAAVRADRFPKCLITNEKVIYSSGNEIKYAELRILTASNQQGGEQ